MIMERYYVVNVEFCRTKHIIENRSEGKWQYCALGISVPSILVYTTTLYLEGIYTTVIERIIIGVLDKQ